MHDQFPTAQLIARGRELTARIAADQAELKSIDEELRSRALAVPHEPLSEGNREGRRAILRDGGEQLTVLFESDLLKQSFTEDSPVARAVLPILAGTETAELFRRKTTYERAIKDGHKFRLHAAALLGPDLAANLIDKLKDRDRNGIVKSKTVIEWKA